MVPFASPHSGTQRRLGQNVSPMVSTLSSYESIIDIIISGSMIPPTFLCSPPKQLTDRGWPRRKIANQAEIILPVLPYPLLTAVRVRPQHSLSKAVRDLSRFTPAGEGGMKLRLIRTVRNTFVPRGDPPLFRCSSLCGRLSREGRIASCRDCRRSSC